MADRPGFAAGVLTAVSAMRGLLLTARAVGRDDRALDEEWTAVRGRLVLILRAYEPEGV
ncbi:hypothetical protein ABZS81_23620 [Streptomyces sp. NPDC005318]|uniref:hypothetical protein n=1 Tax=Streptomyces sp. NPDC005318 TaxID=3157031 RepID=UPI0033ADD82A